MFPKVSLAQLKQAKGTHKVSEKLTVHKLCAYGYPVLYKKGTEESDDVRRITLE